MFPCRLIDRNKRGNQTALTEKIKGKVTGGAKRRSKDKRNCGKYF